MVSGGDEPNNRPKGEGLPVISVSHPNTGSGFGVGVTDYKGRPGVFSKGAAGVRKNDHRFWWCS